MSLSHIALLLTLVLFPFGTAHSEQTPMPDVTVYQSPYCGCCGKWVDYMKAQGFAVSVTKLEEVGAVKQQLGVPEALQSCHTAKVGEYVLEGHVPAEDVQRLLTEKPDAKGLIVAGMPLTAPGMDVPDATDSYEVLLLKNDGTTEVFSKH